jgi:hypothetical protein
MKKTKQIVFVLFILIGQGSFAQSNPILKETDSDFVYAADPAAEVFDGKVYVYCSHDQSDAVGYESMKDYVVLESSDLETWINHGVVLDPQLDEGFEYFTSNMNAPDAAYKDGWYYLYFPGNITEIGVAKSETPVGPWEAAVDTPITTIFDPTGFFDDDGQAYIYGNDDWLDIGDSGRHMMGAKLKDNMIELDGDWTEIAEEDVDEAVHVFKRNGKYYFHGRVGSVTKYWMADTPLPKYATLMGEMAPNAPDAPNHASVIEFDNQWYFFYHRGDVNSGSSVRRSACFDSFFFNDDGTIQIVDYTLEPDSIFDYGEPLDIDVPTAEDQSYYAGDNIFFINVDELWPSDDSEIRVENGGNLGYCQDGNYAIFDSVNFIVPATYEFIVYASQDKDFYIQTGNLLVYLNDEKVGTVKIFGTESWSDYYAFTTTFTIDETIRNGELKLVMETTGSGSFVGNFIMAQYNMTDETDTSASIIQNYGLNSVSIYPTFVTDYFTIDTNLSSSVKYEVVDLYGKIVLTGNVIEQETIPVNFPSGIYNVIVIDENESNISTNKIIKK